MSFTNSLTTEELIRIAHAGGGFYLDGSKRITADLVRIAHAASNHKALIYVSGAKHRSTEDLVHIGAAGKGCVIFTD